MDLPEPEELMRKIGLVGGSERLRVSRRRVCVASFSRRSNRPASYHNDGCLLLLLCWNSQQSSQAMQPLLVSFSHTLFIRSDASYFSIAIYCVSVASVCVELDHPFYRPLRSPENVKPSPGRLLTKSTAVSIRLLPL